MNYEELKPLFLHLNLVMNDDTLNEYIKGQSVTYDQFLEAFKNILSHQSEYFRAIYNNQDKEIDYGLLGKYIRVGRNGYSTECN